MLVNLSFLFGLFVAICTRRLENHPVTNLYATSERINSDLLSQLCNPPLDNLGWWAYFVLICLLICSRCHKLVWFLCQAGEKEQICLLSLSLSFSPRVGADRRLWPAARLVCQLVAGFEALTYIDIYIYVYVCVYMCVCVSVCVCTPEYC